MSTKLPVAAVKRTRNARGGDTTSSSPRRSAQSPMTIRSANVLDFWKATRGQHGTIVNIEQCSRKLPKHYKQSVRGTNLREANLQLLVTWARFDTSAGFATLSGEDKAVGAHKQQTAHGNLDRFGGN